jgi:hypothetical protein
MKIAYFIIGPESSGTRMITKAFVTLGIYGDFRHKQRMDDLDFSKTPDKIVLRRSVPHGDDWPAIADTINLMKQAGYSIIVPIVILRDKDITSKSQIRHSHAGNIAEAKANISFAIDHIHRELSSVGLSPNIISYEPFVKYDAVRKNFFRSMGLPEPTMAFFDANEKYLASAGESEGV